MSYITRLFTPFQLPDGSEAACTRDIDAYLRRTGLASASDYSPETRKAIRFAREKAMRETFFASFIHQYQRKIWNEK